MQPIRSFAVYAAAASLAWASLLFPQGNAQALPTDVPLESIGFWLEIDGEEVWSPVFAGQENAATENPYDRLWSDGSWTGDDTTVAWQNVQGDLDPGVSGAWSITNNAAITQIYAFSVILPVLPVVPNSLMFGSSTLSVSDANFNGVATLTNAVGPVYVGLIDGAPVAGSDLFSAPYSLSAPPGGTIADTQSFGVFPGSVAGPPVGATIGIQHVFSLSPGDSATLNSTFFLVAIPEPGTLVLLLSGLAGLVVAGHRQS